MNKGLGKGVSALFPSEAAPANEQVQMVALASIEANPYQPRKQFQEAALHELSNSIQEHGMMQPIVVRQQGLGYEIVAGERRYRAAQLAGMKEIPAVVRTLTDEQSMELALIENLQREDLTPIEEAEAYSQLLTTLKLKQDQLAKRLGKSRSHLANYIRLLVLPKEVQQLMNEGKLTMGHGRTLVGLKNKAQCVPLARRIVEEGLTVRQIEKIVQELNEPVSRETTTRTVDPFLQEQEHQLQTRFGTSVAIKRKKNKGKIEIEFLSEEDLERILELLQD